jgi:hypothetical protein
MADLFEIVDAGFADAERAGDPTVIWRHRTPDGLDAVVTEGRLWVGPPGHGAYGDGYRYATPMSAILGAARWIENACPDEPAGWTTDPRTGRTRLAGVAKSGERAWVCPRHPDRLPTFARGRLFCASCGRHPDDAIEVPWPPPRSADHRPG